MSPMLLAATVLTGVAGPEGARIDYDDGRPVAIVQINGQPARFLIDTGAAQSVIDRDLARALGLREYAAPPTVRGSSEPGGPRRAAARLAIGGIVIDDARLVMIGGIASGSAGVRGIVGNDILSRSAWKLDGPAAALTFGPRAVPSAKAACEPNAVSGRRQRNMQYHAFVPVILTGSGGGTIRLPGVLDSGSAHSFMNWRAARAIGLKPDPRATGAPRMIARLPQAQLGPKRLQAAEVRVADLPAFDAMGMAGRPAIIIGMNMLRHVAVSAGPGMNRICVE